MRYVSDVQHFDDSVDDVVFDDDMNDPAKRDGQDWSSRHWHPMVAEVGVAVALFGGFDPM